MKPFNFTLLIKRIYSLKYLKSKTLGCKDIGIRKSTWDRLNSFPGYLRFFTEFQYILFPTLYIDLIGVYQKCKMLQMYNVASAFNVSSVYCFKCIMFTLQNVSSVHVSIV